MPLRASAGSFWVYPHEPHLLLLCVYGKYFLFHLRSPQRSGTVTVPPESRDVVYRWDIPQDLGAETAALGPRTDPDSFPAAPDGYRPYSFGMCAQACAGGRFGGDETLQQPLPMDAARTLRDHMNARSLITVRWTDPHTGVVHLEHFPVRPGQG
jgi:hypothetical protein